MLSAKEITPKYLASLRSLVVDCVYRAQLSHESDAIVLRRMMECLLTANIFQADS